MIGRHKYADLKSLKELTEEQVKDVAAYEESKLKLVKPEKAEKMLSYAKSLYYESTPKSLNVTAEILWRMFFPEYKRLFNQEYLKTKDSELNLAAIILYFSKDERFFKNKRLTKITKPSFEKGILVVGGFGNGKSTSMRTVQSLLNQSASMRFGFKNANDVVEMYEKCENPSDKDRFWRIMKHQNMCFDDVKTERQASNYGKANLFKDILEKRSDEFPHKTHILCNYKDGYKGNVQEAVNEFGEMYGGRVDDRIYKMFNVIEFKGKSFRR